MTVDRAHADRIAHLARLRFDDEELTRITAELNRILAHVESLKALDAGGAAAGGGGNGVAATHLATSGAPTVVDCAPTRGTGAEEPDALWRDLGAIAPDWREGFFVVPPLPGVHATEGS
jgi:Asp-tRNA(Asn)/Glu-tRNA(Gln) amidotransferase C subunit